ncbi:MAG: hypothetical protein AAGF71_04170 [Pseudomonadota bacterium]
MATDHDRRTRRRWPDWVPTLGDWIGGVSLIATCILLFIIAGVLS